jgi:hypothetical protein
MIQRSIPLRQWVRSCLWFLDEYSRMARRLKYSEGDLFAVTLRDGRYGMGLIARMPKAGKIVLGYFFDQACEELPTHSMASKAATSRRVAKIWRFGDLRLHKGDWPVLGPLEGFDRSDWPMPSFVRRFEDMAWVVNYSEDDPLTVLEEIRSDPETGRHLESDLLMGAGMVEIVLARTLAAT